MADSFRRLGAKIGVSGNNLRPAVSSNSRNALVAKPHGDRVLDVLGEGQRVTLTEEDNKRIRRQTDKVILVILTWVYFLQILDKSVLGYAATFGLRESTHLAGNQYSLVSSILPIAQLVSQPFMSFLIVRVPHRVLMPTLILGWGIAQTTMSACRNFGDLLATRFFLGLFEAGCLPLFGVITSQWYRRAEQPLRIATWYGTNGLSTMAASALSYGLGHIVSDRLESWQIIFLFVGLLTVCTAPFVAWKLDADIPSARFLSEEDKPKAIERLRANQTGTGSNEFKWAQVGEMMLEPKTYLWFGMSLLLNAAASVTNTFGPIILNGLGYDKYRTSLLNIPFGAIQWIVIMGSCFAAQRFRIKSVVLVLLTVLPIAGTAMLYVLPRDDPSKQTPLLVGYYLLAILYGINPIIVVWIVGNTAGTTKKSTVMAIYNGGSSAGQIIGPLLFNSRDAPAYLPGLRSVLGIFIALAGCALLQLGNLVFLNRRQAARRVRNGKPAHIKDTSMEDRYEAVDEAVVNDSNSGAAGPTMTVGGGAGDSTDAKPAQSAEGIEVGTSHTRIGDNAFLDLTDRQNDEFVSVLYLSEVTKDF
ncbi:dienelactone hydrolase family protein [Apiospora arundinis]